MPDTPKTSFIPKQSMGSASGQAPRRRHFNIINFIGMVVFLCGLILSVGVFFYKDLSGNDLETQKQALAQVKSSFSVGDIESLRELDRRIEVSSALLDGHLSPTMIFDMIEEHTQGDVSFSTFSYLRRESGSAEVIMDGTTFRFNTVALQSKQFSNVPALASAAFTAVTVGEDGLVTFTVTGEANTAAIRYTAPTNGVQNEVIENATTTESTASTTEALSSDLEDLDALIADTESELNAGI